MRKPEPLPRLRIAIEQAAEGSDEAALLEALSAIETEEHAQGARVATGS